jgi:hypothetical protein
MDYTEQRYEESRRHLDTCEVKALVDCEDCQTALLWTAIHTEQRLRERRIEQ